MNLFKIGIYKNRLVLTYLDTKQKITENLAPSAYYYKTFASLDFMELLLPLNLIWQSLIFDYVTPLCYLYFFPLKYISHWTHYT